jgi:hypothetical protein
LPSRRLFLRALILETGLVSERLRVREIDDDEGRRLVQIVLLSVRGMEVAVIARVAFTGEDRVRDVIRNFNADGFGSLYPKYKGGYRRSSPWPSGGRSRRSPSLSRSSMTCRFPLGAWLRWPSSWWPRGWSRTSATGGLRVLLRQEGVTFQRLKTWKGPRTRGTRRKGAYRAPVRDRGP